MNKYCLIRAAALCIFPLLVSATTLGRAAIIPVNPTNYQAAVSAAQPGDVLDFAAGDYFNRLSIRNKHGSPNAYITFRGPATGARAVFHADACCNTINIGPASYIKIQNFEVDGDGNDGSFAVSADGWSHHIEIEGLYIHDQAVRDDGTVVGDNQSTAISTKAPAAFWIIRNNVIQSPGIGMYLGNSDHTRDFVGGIIEGNLIMNAIGYGMQIKAQGASRDPEFSTVPGMAVGDEKTVIRHNVFMKDRDYAIAARPNLLVGGFPDSGSGSNDRYEIYGNFFYQNPDECLAQLTGTVAFYGNIGYNTRGGCGVLFTAHEGHPLKNTWAYNNTIVTTGSGIRVSSPSVGSVQRISGNAIFTATPLSGGTQSDNVTGSYAAAATYLNNPAAALGALDLFPKAGQLSGALFDRSAIQLFSDWNRDFNGAINDGTYRGAYAGSGTNPGWQLAATQKPIPSGAAAPVVTFSASPLTIPSGGATTLTWSSIYASACAASGGWSGSKASSGTQLITSITNTTNYMLFCTGSAGSTSATVTVTTN